MGDYILDQAGLVESVIGEAVTQVQFFAITGNIFESSVSAYFN